MMNPLTYLIDYRLTPTSVQVVALAGNFVIREFPYSDIVEVKRGFELMNEQWGNRLDIWRSAVSLRLNRPILPWVVLTPEDPDSFILELRRNLAA